MLTPRGSVKCQYDGGQDPLQQEGNCREPSWRQSVDVWRRERPVPVLQLSPGPGRLSGPLRLVRTTFLTSLLMCVLWPLSLHTSFSDLCTLCFSSRWVSNAFSIRGGKPLWVDPFDPNVQHIFIDDNIRQNDKDTVVHPKVVESSSTLTTVPKMWMYSS